jgi:hypothetical protein
MKRQTIKKEKVKIFSVIETEIGLKKKYIHPINTTLYAHVRQLSAFEKATNQTLQDGSDIQFTVNQRVINQSMLIEWKNNTYAIDGIDNYEFENGRDIVIRAHQVTVNTYVATEYTGW